jgi:alkanesulfonate monooxygenase SsuD/methylene tetrahydromethanopterin reductase-like flavin-dependent oxidoreductase (luciferase family)
VVEATERIRVCPMVINNDFHHPVHLASEIANLDQLTGGRTELGIGAGHSFTEYAAIGQPFDPPAVRKARLGEAVEIIRRLIDGEEVDVDGEHYRLRGVRTMRSQQEHLPILVGVNGRAALAHAARHADTIGLTMLGRTLEDGQRHEVRWEAERLDATVEWIRAYAGGRDVDDAVPGHRDRGRDRRSPRRVPSAVGHLVLDVAIDRGDDSGHRTPARPGQRLTASTSRRRGG